MKQLIRNLLLSAKSENSKETFVTSSNILTEYLTHEPITEVLEKEELNDLSSILSTLICFYYDDTEGQLEIVYLINELVNRIGSLDSNETVIILVLDSIQTKIEKSLGTQTIFNILIFLKLILESKVKKCYQSLYSVIKKIMLTVQVALTEVNLSKEVVSLLYSVILKFEIGDEKNFVVSFFNKRWIAMDMSCKASVVTPIVNILTLVQPSIQISNFFTRILTSLKNIKIKTAAAKGIARTAVLILYKESKSEEETEEEMNSFFEKISGLNSKITYYSTCHLCFREPRILSNSIMSRSLINFIIDCVFLPNLISDDNSSQSDESTKFMVVNSKEMLFASKMLPNHPLLKRLINKREVISRHFSIRNDQTPNVS